MDGSRAAWRTFGDVDGSGPLDGGPAPGSSGGRTPDASTERPDPAAPGPSWMSAPEVRGGLDTRGPADGPRSARRFLPAAVAAAAGVVAMVAILVVALGGGASAVVVDGGGAPGAPGARPSTAGDIPAGGVSPSDGPAASAGIGAAIPAAIIVDVEGAVPRPGLVRLTAGARVGDAIAAAGGYAPTVDVARAAAEVNLAARVADGDRVHVPATGDAAMSAGASGPSTQDGATASAAPGLVDLNRASASELDALPGIGPVTAEKIIKARATAAFRTVQELRDRKVVTAATFAKIAPLVTVAP